MQTEQFYQFMEGLQECVDEMNINKGFFTRFFEYISGTSYETEAHARDKTFEVLRFRWTNLRPVVFGRFLNEDLAGIVYYPRRLNPLRKYIKKFVKENRIDDSHFFY